MAPPDARRWRGLRWLFEDRTTGTIVIAQAPNVALMIFLCAFAAHLLLRPRGTADTIIRATEIVSLSAWALDEFIRGVNPWRRILGAGTGLYLLGSWLLR